MKLGIAVEFLPWALLRVKGLIQSTIYHLLLSDRTELPGCFHISLSRLKCDCIITITKISPNATKTGLFCCRKTTSY